ncbi:lipoprotein [Leptospira ryugenii]|uniref:Lipoprotein n=1 Tax=Leptospira ryugenii TaxID=1917863 RepID=A0A2P2E2L5_9LEPT|nr:lipoprotein [Leptospira ryugenii]
MALAGKSEVSLASKAILGFSFLLLLVSGCATDYNEIIQSTENSYYAQNYDSAIPSIRALYEDSSTKDRLLFLMEAGMIFHSKGDFQTSNKVFKEAEELSDNIRTSLTKEGLAFLLSDNESNYTGEDFERVMIKFFIALNFLSMGELENAKIYFRRLDFELKEMKFTSAEYRQNNAARLLDAYVSEKLGKFNDARVQFKNMESLIGSNQTLVSDRFVLAAKENDGRDMGKYAKGSGLVQAYNHSMQKVDFRNERLTEVVIIHEAGKSAIKESRGKLLEDEYFAAALRGAIEIAARSEGAGVSVAGVLATLSTAENPIPIYKERDWEGSQRRHFYVNGVDVGAFDIMNNYSDTAIKNFNDNYKALITKNVTSLAVKVVAAVIASEAAAKAIESGLGDKNKNDLLSGLIRLAAGAAAGLATAQVIGPDLRCWRTIPSNFQIKRLFLEPGEYSLKLDEGTGITSNLPRTILVEEGKPLFLPVRSYKN